MKILGEIKTTDTTASKTGNKVTDISNEKIINISGTFTVGNSGAKYGATIYCIIDAYVDGQWINIHQVSQSRPARSSTTFNLDFNTIVYDATQVRVAYSSTDNETSKTWNINIYTGELDVSEFVCNDTATIMSYSSRNFIKDVSGFALCGLYYNGTYKGPVVISPTQSVASTLHQVIIQQQLVLLHMLLLMEFNDDIHLQMLDLVVIIHLHQVIIYIVLENFNLI